MFSLQVPELDQMNVIRMIVLGIGFIGALGYTAFLAYSAYGFSHSTW